MKPMVVLSGDANDGWRCFEEALARGGYPYTYGPFEDRLDPDPRKHGAPWRYSEIVCFHGRGSQSVLDTVRFCTTHNTPLIVFTGGMKDLKGMVGFEDSNPGFPLIYLDRALTEPTFVLGVRLVNALLFVAPKINALRKRMYRPEAIPAA